MVNYFIYFLWGIIGSIIFFYMYLKLNNKFLKEKEKIKDFLVHHQHKNHTPNKGGIGIFLIMVPLLLYIKEYFLLIIATSCFLIGLADDLMKKNGGLNNYIRIIVWSSVGFLVGLVSYWSYGGSIYIPILNMILNLKLFYVFFISIFFFLGVINGVNMTDGLDGMVTFPLILNFLFLFIVSVVKNEIHISYICICMIGILLGFLYFNINKARIFMSDCGAIFLGGFLGTLYVLLKVEFFLPIVGIVFVVNVITSFIQVTSIKYFKKKIFLMAPLHHHFELLGVKETTIVFYVWWWSLLFFFIGVGVFFIKM
jgi:phospho-N-acetylmuramoyl-pentapeptide-transferase